MEDKLEKAAREFARIDDEEKIGDLRNSCFVTDNMKIDYYNCFKEGAEWMKANYNKAQKCPVCEGKGYINVGGSYSIATTVCPTCKGNRIIYIK